MSMSTASSLAGRELGGLQKFLEVKEGGGEIFSLLSTWEDKFFTYNPTTNSICVGEIKELLNTTGGLDRNQGQGVSLTEELPLRSKLWFEIASLSVIPGNVGQYLCLLWGTRGVLLVTLGSRNFGSSTFYVLQEKFLAEKEYKVHPSLTVFQCKWFPDVKQKLVVVLNSDSYLRIYHSDSGQPFGGVNLGCPSNIPLRTTYSPDISPDTPVDFDFGPYLTAKCWTMFVLKPTGLIFCALFSLLAPSSSTPCILTNYRQIPYLEDIEEDDNYSKIICSKTFPVLCVTSQESGRVSHIVLIPTKLGAEFEPELDTPTYLANDWYRLFIKEHFSFPPIEDDPTNSMQLWLDPMFDNRYVCVHGKGAHLVSVKFVTELDKILHCDDESFTLNNLSGSVSRNIMVWEVGPKSSSTSKLSGVAITSSYPQRLFCVLKDSRTVLYCLPHPRDLLQLGDRYTDSELDLQNGRSLDEVVGKILRQTADHPFYCVDNEPNKKDALKVLMSSFLAKDEQMKSIETAENHINRYLKSVSSITKDFNDKLQILSDRRTEFKESAESLANEYEELVKQDYLIAKRMEQVRFRYHLQYPTLTKSEKDWRQKLESMRRDVSTLQSSVDELTKRKEGTNKWNDARFAPCSIPNNHLDSIKDQIHYNQNVITKLSAILRDMEELRKSV